MINPFFSWFSVNLTGRIVWTLLIEVIVFVVTIVLAMVDTAQYPGVFFYITMASIVTLNSKYTTSIQPPPARGTSGELTLLFLLLAVANGVYQSTVFGLAAKLPFKYTGAVVLGTVSTNTNFNLF